MEFEQNHSISELIYTTQDGCQNRSKGPKIDSDLPHANKIDITIVVDMLLTGFG